MPKDFNINSILGTDDILLKIKKKSEAGFWDWQLFGFLTLAMDTGQDYFVITEKKIVYIIQNKVLKNLEYHNFESISFNSNSDTISLKNINNEDVSFKLSKLRLTYDEIQLLKNKLNA